MILEAYTDVDYAGSIEDKKIYILILHFSWRKFGYLGEQETKYWDKIKCTDKV